MKELKSIDYSKSLGLDDLTKILNHYPEWLRATPKEDKAKLRDQIDKTQHGENSEAIKVIQEIRDGFLEDPNYQPDEEKLSILAQNPEICKQFHVNFKSGKSNDKWKSVDEFSEDEIYVQTVALKMSMQNMTLDEQNTVAMADSKIVAVARAKGVQVSVIMSNVKNTVDMQKYFEESTVISTSVASNIEMPYNANTYNESNFIHEEEDLFDIGDEDLVTITKKSKEETTSQLTNAEVEIAVSNKMKDAPDFAELYGQLVMQEQEVANQVVAQQVVMENVIQEEISQVQNSIKAKQIQTEMAKLQETTQIEQVAVKQEQEQSQEEYQSATFEDKPRGLRKLFGGIADFFSSKRKLGSNNQKALNAGGDEKANTVYQARPSKEGFGLADSTNGLVPTRVGIRNTLGNIGKSLMNLFSSNKKEPDVITNQATIVDENGTVSTPDIFAVSDEVKKATIEVSKKAAQDKAEKSKKPIIPTTKNIENVHQADDGPVIE